MINRIIADEDVLEEGFVPPSLPCREHEKEQLKFYLSPLEQGDTPTDCLCHGKPGTGKTALVRHMMEQINENTTALAFYVNCWQSKTLNTILDRLVGQAHVIVSQTDYSSKLKRLKEKISERACVIALDEIDKLKPEKLNDAVYMLKSLGKVGIVGISNTRKVFISLDARNLSRVTFQTIPFPPYSIEEIRTILKHRIVDCRALYPDTWSYPILNAIAELAGGDARIALQTLKRAARSAEKANRKRIGLDDMQKASEDVEAIKKKYELESLNEHHIVLFEVIKKNPGISSSQLVERYRHEGEQRGLLPKSVRTLTNYVNELIRLGQVRFDRAHTKGNVRCFFATWS